MPLRYVDPTGPANMATRALNRSSRSRLGQFVAGHLASKTDPWLGRICNGRVSWGCGPSATLKSTGVRSGQAREAQIAYFHDEPDVIVIASNDGGDKHPQWYHNLIAHPQCELGDDAFRATEVTDPDEYSRLYGLAECYYADFADYRTKTAQVGRGIPVIRLTPR